VSQATNEALRFVFSEAELRQQLCDIGRMLYERGFIGLPDGNLAVRLDYQRLLVTPAGCLKGFMEPDMMVVTDLRGNPTGEGRPSTEIRLHVAVLEERPDVHAVLHAHAPYSTAFSIAGLAMARCIIPEIVVTLGTVPMVPYATPGTDELPDCVREPIRSSDALVLERHGTVTVGSDLWDAFRVLDMVEHASRITHLARQLGKVKILDENQVERLMKVRKDLGIGGKNTICDDCAARAQCSHPLFP